VEKIKIYRIMHMLQLPNGSIYDIDVGYTEVI